MSYLLSLILRWLVLSKSHFGRTSVKADARICSKLSKVNIGILAEQSVLFSWPQRWNRDSPATWIKSVSCLLHLCHDLRWHPPFHDIFLWEYSLFQNLKFKRSHKQKLGLTRPNPERRVPETTPIAIYASSSDELFAVQIVYRGHLKQNPSHD